MLNLHVNPVAGDVTIAPVSTPEDTGVRFLNALALTDTDGSESITGITINTVPAGWVIRDDTGVVVFTGNGAAAYSVPAGEVTNGDFNYTVTPAATAAPTGLWRLPCRRATRYGEWRAGDEYRHDEPGARPSPFLLLPRLLAPIATPTVRPT